MKCLEISEEIAVISDKELGVKTVILKSAPHYRANSSSRRSQQLVKVHCISFGKRYFNEQKFDATKIQETVIPYDHPPNANRAAAR